MRLVSRARRAGRAQPQRRRAVRMAGRTRGRARQPARGPRLSRRGRGDRPPAEADRSSEPLLVRARLPDGGSSPARARARQGHGSAAARAAARVHLGGVACASAGRLRSGDGLRRTRARGRSRRGRAALPRQCATAISARFGSRGKIFRGARERARGERSASHATRATSASPRWRSTTSATSRSTSGDYDRARAALRRESCAPARSRGYGEHRALALQQWGGRPDAADAARSPRSRFRESLELARHSGDREDIAWSLLGLSAVEIDNGNGQRGALLLGAARRVLSEMSAAYKPFERQLDQQTEERSRALNGDEDHQAAVARGLALGLDEALDLVLDRVTSPV